MGGTIPLGYDVKNRKLVINEQEADRVRLVFRQYLAVGCLAKLRTDLEQRGARDRGWHRDGRHAGAGEALSRNMRDRRAVARYAGLTGSPDESGRKRREKGLARSGNARVRRGMIQLAWRFLMFQKDSALAQWFRARTENARGTRKTMIVALARKLLIAF